MSFSITAEYAMECEGSAKEFLALGSTGLVLVAVSVIFVAEGLSSTSMTSTRLLTSRSASASTGLVLAAVSVPIVGEELYSTSAAPARPLPSRLGAAMLVAAALSAACTAIWYKV